MSVLVDLKNRSPRWMKDAAATSTRRYALATAGQRTMPDFLVVGAKRGGTTSTYNYLLQHPGVSGLFPQSQTKKSSDFFFKRRHLGERWYRSHFPTHAYRSAMTRRLGYAPVAGEASPYYLWDPRIAAQIREVAPQVKAIALLRDPVERAYSHFKERIDNGVEPLGFVEALAAEEDRTAGELDRMLADPSYYSTAHDWYAYRARGVYLPQLQNWHAVWPAEQLLILRSEDLYADVQATFDRICDFLGIDHYQLPRTRQFGTAHDSSIPEAARAELTDYFAPHNRALEDYLGRSMDWSS